MSLVKHYILDGQTPKIVDLLTWARWFEDHRKIFLTTVDDKTAVSTVFLGIDHDFNRAGPPLLFETMILGGPLDGRQWRCAFYKEAERQHASAVDEAQKAAKQISTLANNAGAKS